MKLIQSSIIMYWGFSALLILSHLVVGSSAAAAEEPKAVPMSLAIATRALRGSTDKTDEKPSLVRKLPGFLGIFTGCGRDMAWLVHESDGGLSLLFGAQYQYWGYNTIGECRRAGGGPSANMPPEFGLEVVLP